MSTLQDVPATEGCTIIQNLHLARNSLFVVAGRSGSGKTTFVVDLCERLSQYMIDGQPPRSVHIFYDRNQSLYQKLADYCKKHELTFNMTRGMPTVETLEALAPSSCVILDDLQAVFPKHDANLRLLFNNLLHHLNISICFAIVHTLDRNASLLLKACRYLAIFGVTSAQMSSVQRALFTGQTALVHNLVGVQRRFDMRKIVLDLHSNFTNKEDIERKKNIEALAFLNWPIAEGDLFNGFALCIVRVD